MTEAQRQEIREAEGVTQAELARRYGVSRGTIRFIREPERLEQNLQRRAERGGSKIYYDREKHTETMREYGRHKQRLLKKGLLE